MTASAHTLDRRGATVLEAMVAAVVFVAGSSVVATMVVAAAQQRRGVENHRFAIQHAENLLARLAAQPFDSLTAERAEQIRLALPDHPALNKDQMRVELTSEAGPPESKRIVVVAAWQTPSGQPARSLRLTTWIYR
jgi:Tfp pilus assembly protein PilV